MYTNSVQANILQSTDPGSLFDSHRFDAVLKEKMLRRYTEAESKEKHGVWDSMPELTITSPSVLSKGDTNTLTWATLCQGRLYPPSQGLRIWPLASTPHIKMAIIQDVNCVGRRIMTRSRVPDPFMSSQRDQRHVFPSTHRSRAQVFKF